MVTDGIHNFNVNHNRDFNRCFNMELKKIDVGFGSWFFIQVALFVIHYGFEKTLPWWVLWLPSLIVSGVLVIAISLLLGGILIILIKGVFKNR